MNIIDLWDMPFAFIFKFFEKCFNFVFILLNSIFGLEFKFFEFSQLTLKSLIMHLLFVAIKANLFKFTGVFALQWIFLLLKFVDPLLLLHLFQTTLIL